jgi:hypothetical protein
MRMLQKSFLSLVAGGIWTLGSVAWAGTMDTGAPFPTPVDGPPFEVAAPPFTTPVEGRPFDLPVDGPPFDVVRLGSRIEAAGIYWTTLAGLVSLPPPTSAAQIANPEPTTWLLLGLGLGGLGVLRRVRSRG